MKFTSLYVIIEKSKIVEHVVKNRLIHTIFEFDLLIKSDLSGLNYLYRISFKKVSK